jgi:hypothetical protein
MINKTKEETVSVTIKLPISLYNRIDTYYKEVYEINNKQDRKNQLKSELVDHCDINIGIEYSY